MLVNMPLEFRTRLKADVRSLLERIENTSQPSYSNSASSRYIINSHMTRQIQP